MFALQFHKPTKGQPIHAVYYIFTQKAFLYFLFVRRRRKPRLRLNAAQAIAAILFPAGMEKDMREWRS